MQHRSRFARRLCIAVDTEGYGARDNVAQYDLQALLPDILDEAAAEARLDRSLWATQRQGDGELALVPPDQPEPRVVDDFMHELAAVLRLRNYGRPPAGHLRLRAAIHFGVAYEAPNGFAGAAVVATARLLASESLHRALRQDAHADLAVALSPEVYQTVMDRHTSLTPDQFYRVNVEEKEYKGDAWIRTLPPNAPPAAPPGSKQQQAESKMPLAGPQRPARPASASPYSVQNNFHDQVDAGVIGINIAPLPEDKP